MAEELRELRLSKQIPAKDMVAVVQQFYPKYDKTVQSKCENGDAYGVSLRPDAMAALYAHFAPELAEAKKPAKRDARRLTCRISARLETADYETIGKAVGGYIEVVHPKGLPDPYCMIVNEEGLLQNLPWNLFGSFLYGTIYHGNPIVGDIVILKEGFTTPGERDFIGLDEDDIKFLGAMAVSESGGDIKWESEGQ